jgi:nitrogen regulatory protein A
MQKSKGELSERRMSKMNPYMYEAVYTICRELAVKLPFEFVGLAISTDRGEALRWQCVVGNRNDKYKRITVRYGKGIAGQTLRTGRMMIINSFPERIPGKPTEYPIMLAEQLVSCIAVPIFFGGSVWGILLGGHRSAVTYTENAQECITDAALKIQQILVRDTTPR